MAAMERQGQALNERLVASQDGFHGKAEAAYAGLAASVDRSLTGEPDRERPPGRRDDPAGRRGHDGRHRARDRRAARRHRARPCSGSWTACRRASKRPPPPWPTTGRTRWPSSAAPARRCPRTCAARWTASPRPSSSARPRWWRRLDPPGRARSAACRTAGAARWRSTAHQRGPVARHAAGPGGGAASFEQHAAALLRTVDAGARRPADADRVARRAAPGRLDRVRWRPWPRRCSSEWQQAGAQRRGPAAADLRRRWRETARDISAQTEAQRRQHDRRDRPPRAGRLGGAARGGRSASPSCVRSSPTAWRATTRCWRSAAACWRRWATLLDAVNHASTEQRAAIDALVGARPTCWTRRHALHRQGRRARPSKMADIAAQVTGSAVEVASLGEAFGFARAAVQPVERQAGGAACSASKARSASPSRAATSSWPTTWRRRAR